jgi:HK97 family phage portal protein
MGSRLIASLKDFWPFGVKKYFTPITDGDGSSLLPNTRYNYASNYNGNRVFDNSIVGACVNWMGRTFPEAGVGVRRYDAATQQNVVVGDHALRLLLQRPNPYFSGRLLRMAICTDFIVHGNAYLLKVRSANGNVVQLWWAPASTLSPDSTRNTDVRTGFTPTGEDKFISGYSYDVGNTEITIPPEDVVHMRYGIDPDNTQLGRSPLQSVMREMFTDDEAANFSASLLRNMGVPGVVLAPGDGVGAVGDAELAQIKDKWNDQFGGDNRGRLMVMRGKTQVTTVSWSPEQMNLRELRRIPEERVSAVLGVPAIVAGLGAGLDRSTYANMAEAREMAWESGLIPIQRLIADDLSNQLLPEFDEDPTAEVFFDYTDVRVLQADATDLARRWRELVEGSIAKRSEARAALDLPVDDSDDVFLMPMNRIEVGPGGADVPVAEDEKYDVVLPHDHEHHVNGQILEDDAELQAALDNIQQET